jgi:hypothetical protein
MKTRILKVGAPLALVAIAAAFLIYQSKGALPSGQDLYAHELSLVSARCTKAESVDRWLLQQSWFHDPGFTQLAGAFGQTSFTLFQVGTPTKETEGAFCISGNDLMVRYYERRFVPIRIRPSKMSIEFGTKLVPLGEDVYSVRASSQKKEWYCCLPVMDASMYSIAKTDIAYNKSLHADSFAACELDVR